MVEDPKELLVGLLQGNIKVYDDDGVEVPGVVSAAWPDERIFRRAAWHVTVGPVIDARARVIDLGALHKAYGERLQVSVWVLRKRGVNYTPERLRHDLIHEIDRILFKAINDPSPGVRHINLSGWMDRDEPERGILRSVLIVDIEYQKARRDIAL